MSLEIDQKIMKAIILSIKDDFKEEDYAILENALERIKKSEQYETAQILWNVEGYKQILKQREYQNGFCSRLWSVSSPAPVKNSCGVTPRYSQMRRNSCIEGNALPIEILRI